jgi:DNA modification methylase
VIHYATDDVTLHHGRALEIARELPSKSVQTIVTSPPYYGLRDYKRAGQYGNERRLVTYIRNQVTLFRELRRVLADDGTLWLNLADSYAGRANAGRRYQVNREKHQQGGIMPGRTNTTGDAPFKNLLMVPHKTAIALQKDGWILRNDIIWRKPNSKPESVKDRMTQTYEHLFLFSKRPRYYFDLDAVREPRNKRVWWMADEIEYQLPNPGDVWDIPVTPFPGAHFATFPRDLPARCIIASTRGGDVVLDPFSGSGTTGLAAISAWPPRQYIGIDLNEEYLDLSLRTRFAHQPLTIEGAS